MLRPVTVVPEPSGLGPRGRWLDHFDWPYDLVTRAADTVLGTFQELKEGVVDLYLDNIRRAMPQDLTSFIAAHAPRDGSAVANRGVIKAAMMAIMRSFQGALAKNIYCIDRL